MNKVMSQRTLAILLFILFRALSCSGVKPNIILIVADDLGWNDVGFHGSNQIPTPNIDALAYSGIILNNYYTMPMCTPSRSALMTGKHPIHTGMQNNIISAPEPWGLGTEEKLLPQYLKDQGYATHAVGKWHLGFFEKEYTPRYRGFDRHFGYWCSHQNYYNHTLTDFGYFGYDLRRDMDVVTDVDGEYTTTLLTREAEDIILNHDASVPLFLYLAHEAVHVGDDAEPLQAPPETIALFEYIEDYDRRVFAAMLHELDGSVGVVMRALAQRQLLNNSIVVFTTDNGGTPTVYSAGAGSNWPLRGTKQTVWQGGIRGVACLWSPFLKVEPYVSTQLSHIQDWLPTLMSAINESDSLSSQNLDGIDLWGAFNHPSTPNVRDDLLINIEENVQYALIMREWKLLSGGKVGNYSEIYPPTGREGMYNFTMILESEVAKALQSIGATLPSAADMLQLRNTATVSCVYQNVTSTCDAVGGEVCLFNLAEDPCEVETLASQFPDLVLEMQALLDAYNATAVAPRNQPIDPTSDPVYWNNTWTNWRDYPSPL